VQLQESRTIIDLHEGITDALATKQRSTAAELLREDLLTAEDILRNSKGQAPRVGTIRRAKAIPGSQAKRTSK
jgi:DNA-binding GntR family transcriptional regulator